jgi:t-SNARE complex subunit (syntaxin)
MHASTLAKNLEFEGHLLAARNPASSQHSNHFIAALTIDVRPHTAQATGHKRGSIQQSRLSANGTSSCLRICATFIISKEDNIVRQTIVSEGNGSAVAAQHQLKARRREWSQNDLCD